VDPSNFAKDQWRRILDRARIGQVRPKDLRDTYASQLLTAGVQLGYISRQLGHADVGVTARHYAKWCGDDGYREPLQIAPGEVPADLLARLQRPHSDPTYAETERAGS
jgi:integrase